MSKPKILVPQKGMDVQPFLSFPFGVTVDTEAGMTVHSQRSSVAQLAQCATPVCAKCPCVSGELLLSQQTGIWCL